MWSKNLNLFVSLVTVVACGLSATARADIDQIDRSVAQSKSISISVQVERTLGAVKSKAEAQDSVDALESQITMFIAIWNTIVASESSRESAASKALRVEIDRLRIVKEKLQESFASRYSTSIRPNNKNLRTTAFRAAETFPKIPYYVPGTNESGEFLVIPRVTDSGALVYDLRFLDLTAEFENTRESITISHHDLVPFVKGLRKINEWTTVAHQENINRRIAKTAVCIPAGQCDTRREGVSSTEVIFQVYEDTTTSGRIQRNKGMYSVGYNVSVDSTLLLVAYMTYMGKIGWKEFNVATMTDDEIDSLFK